MAKKKSPLVHLLDFLSSYWLASALLFCLFLLTLSGTLAQVNDGIYLAQKKYFESWYVFHPTEIGLVIPLPGGMTCMGLLAVNLLLGGLVRIRKSVSTAGVIVIHIGIALMLAAALVKQKASDDGFLKLYEGESSDEFVHFHDWQVAVFDATEQTSVEEWLISDELLKDLVQGKTRSFELPELGVELVLSNFVENGRPLPKGPNWTSPFPTVDGYAVREMPFEAEAAERNMACLYVEARPVGGESSQGILWALERLPWTFEVGDKTLAVSLRHRRIPMPFEISLDKFTRELHPRTGIPKVFSSEVTQLDLDARNTRRVEISMNEPLRSEGLVLFQSSWGPANAREGEALFSQFSVVRNPSDAWPLYSCIIISIGLLMAFGQKLAVYIRRQNKARSNPLVQEAA